MKFNAMMLAMLMAFSLAFASPYSIAPLTYAALSADTYRVAAQGGDAACAATSSGDFLYNNAKLIEMKSASPIFGGPGDVLSGDYYFSKVLFDPIGLTGNGSTSLNGTYFQSTNTSQWAPRVFWKLPGRDCYNWNNLTYSPVYPYSEMIGVPSANTNSSFQMSGIWFSGYAYPGLASGIQTIFFSEYAGTNGPGTETWVTSGVPFIANNPSYPTIRFKPSDNSTSLMYYRAAGTTNFFSYEPVFITERGTRYLSVGTTDVSAQVATKIAKPSFVFRTAAAPVPPTPSASFPQYTLETLITDTVDKTPQNRQNTLPEDQYASLLSDPDTGGQVTSPLRSVFPGMTVAKNLYRIGAGQYPTFADYAVNDWQATNASYVEKQAYWMGSTPAGVAYDAGAAMRDVVVNRYSAMASSAKFEGNDFGIPICSGNLNPLLPGDYTSCTNNSSGVYGVSALSDRHRMGIRFLNGEWIVSEMIAPTTPLASGTAAINGGQVRLAKEAKYGILSVNQTLYNSPLSVRLLDVLAPGSCQYNESVALYAILNQSMAAIGQIQVCPGTTYTFWQSGTNNKVKLHTYKDQSGNTSAEKWAETAIYSDEIVLKDSARYNLVSSQDPDKNFKVSLLWKNRGYTGNGSSTVADSLREMVVYQVDNFDKTPRGGVYSFLSSQPAFQVTYAGINVITNVGPAPKPLPTDSIQKGGDGTPAEDAAGAPAATKETMKAEADG